MMKGFYTGLFVVLVVLVIGGVMVYRSTEPDGDVVPDGDTELRDESVDDPGSQFLQQQPDSLPPIEDVEDAVLPAVPEGALEDDSEATGTPATGETVTISMDDTGYTPQNVTIAAGTAVTFVNNGQGTRWPASNVHPTHEVLPAFDPRRGLSTGEEYSFTFSEPGAWRYHDHLKPSVTGTITVE